MTFCGWRIYYADGSVLSSQNSIWAEAPQDGVEIVVVFYAETYQIWREDHFDVENYCTLLNGGDYYWIDSDGVPRNGNAPSVPADLPDLVTKTGRQLSEEAFGRIYTRANEERGF